MRPLIVIGGANDFGEGPLEQARALEMKAPGALGLRLRRELALEGREHRARQFGARFGA
jgi:hypothetical protein